MTDNWKRTTGRRLGYLDPAVLDGIGRRFMQQKFSEKSDLDLVQHLIGSSSLELERFTQQEMSRGKTPDFKIIFNGKLVGYCEVKSPRDEWLQEQMDTAPSGRIVGGLRNDPTFNRLSNTIHKAVRQFKAVNGDNSVLNVLVIVNHDRASGPNDLRETLTGNFLADDGSLHPINKRISEGRIRDDKRLVDLYIMIDSKTKKITAEFLTASTPIRFKLVCELFNISEELVRR